LTGPGPGKIKLCAKVYLWSVGKREPLDATVYLHVKGWSRARVTHIDVESPGIEYRLVGGPKQGVYGEIVGTGSGIIFSPFRSTWRLEVEEKQVLARALRGGEKCIGYLGGKHGGIFIGFQKHVLRLLEKLAEELYGVTPNRSR